MATEVKWIKISTGLFDDDKIKLIRSMPDGESMIVIWLQLLILAGKVNQDGMLVVTNTEIPYTNEMLSTHFGMNLNTVIMAISTFTRFGMIEIIDDIYHVTNWSKYQTKDDVDESVDNSREKERLRKKAQRERKKALPQGDGAPPLPPAQPKETPLQRRFERFWEAYPRKVGKGAAEKSFSKIKPSEELTDIMIKAVEAAKRSPQWMKDGGQFIPHPATWLNQKRWEDEIPQAEPMQPTPADRRLENWD
ncbi:MAG: phage replisome organizer N-terminal domain-containing protein [Aristaeellaceae bacterium]